MKYIYTIQSENNCIWRIFTNEKDANNFKKDVQKQYPNHTYTIKKWWKLSKKFGYLLDIQIKREQ